MMNGFGFIDRLIHRRTQRVLRRLTTGASTARADQLRDAQRDLSGVREAIKCFDDIAEQRLRRPRRDHDPVFPKAADWTGRPYAWREVCAPSGIASVPNGTRFAPDLAVFHDCALAEISTRQIRNSGHGPLPPFGVQLDVIGFEGSFLSFAIDLDDAALDDLSQSCIIRADLMLERDRHTDIDLRLNVRNGPNIDRVYEQITSDAARHTVEFDLAYSDFSASRVEAAWIDVVFKDPAANRIILRDMALSRRLRAPL